MLQFDIDQVKRLASTLRGVGTEIDSIDVRTAAAGIDAALVGCGAIPTVSAQVGEYTEGAYLRVARRVTHVAGVAERAANDMATTDQQFKRKLDELDFKQPGQR